MPASVALSRRSLVDLRPNRLAVAVARAREQGRPLLDLTVTNPTRAGLPDAAESILDALHDARALSYEPGPLGSPAARSAVAAECRRQGLGVDPSQVLLTASTSEAYAFLFKLLCDPGDEVLVPRPSYPLLEHLARLDSVRLVPYQLAYDTEEEWVVGLVEQKGTPGGIYHLSAQDERDNRTVAESICALCDIPVRAGIRYVDDRPGHDRRYGLDSAKLRGLGWQPEVDFGRGLRETVAYFRAHPRTPAPARS